MMENRMARSLLDQYPVQTNSVGRIVDGEAVIVFPESGQVKVLNQVGARIWSLMDGSRTVQNIAEVICDEYQVEKEHAEADVLEFTEKLEKTGVVTLVAEPLSAGTGLDEAAA